MRPNAILSHASHRPARAPVQVAAAGNPADQAERAVRLGATALLPFLDFGSGSCAIVEDPHGATFGLLNVKE